MARPDAELSPEVTAKIFPVQLVFENGEGQVTMVMLGHLAINLYPLAGKERSRPKERLAALKAFIASVEQELYDRVLVQMNLFPGLNLGLGPVVNQLRQDG